MYGIQKLTGESTYLAWSAMAKASLTGQGLWHVMDETIRSILEKDTPAESTLESDNTTGESSAQKELKRAREIKKFEIQNARDMCLIMGTCGKKPLQYILRLKTAKEQWDVLERIYGPRPRRYARAGMVYTCGLGSWWICGMLTAGFASAKEYHLCC